MQFGVGSSTQKQITCHATCMFWKPRRTDISNSSHQLRRHSRSQTLVHRQKIDIYIYTSEILASLSIDSVFGCAMASKKHVIVGAWTLVGAAAGTKLFLDHGKYQKLPCVQLALEELAAKRQFLEPLKLGLWPRQGHLDANAGLMRARFQVCGADGAMAHVLVGAKREKQHEDLEGQEDEDQDWKYYWLRPWEFKKALVDKIRSIGRGSLGSALEDDPSQWRLETLVVLPDGGKDSQALLGNPLSLPEYEAFCLRRDQSSKDDLSRRRLHTALCISFMATILAGGARLVRSGHVWQSHGFVRKAVLEDRKIKAVLGPSHIESCTGTFTPTYINAQLKLVGNAGAVADVTVAASRDSSHQSWHIASARMNVGGVMCKLDLAR